MCKMFSLLPSKKPVTREDWDKLPIYFSIFWVIKLTKTPILPNCQVPNVLFFCINVDCIVKKLKSKRLVFLIFFEGTRENIVHIFQALIKTNMAKERYKCIVFWNYNPNKFTNIAHCRTCTMTLLPSSPFCLLASKTQPMKTA